VAEECELKRVFCVELGGGDTHVPGESARGAAAAFLRETIGGGATANRFFAGKSARASRYLFI